MLRQLQCSNDQQFLTCDNAYAERFVGSIKGECLNRLVFFGEASLRRAIREYIAHYHRERNHQGLGNTLIAANDGDFAGNGSLARRSRLGGMLNYYHREAA
jgi:putative transposase